MAFLGITGMSYAANAQHWLASVSGTTALFSGEYKGNHLAVDTNGNTYTTGTYRASTSAAIQTSAYSSGETGTSGIAAFSVGIVKANSSVTKDNSFITKTDSNGEIKWLLGFGSTSPTQINTITNTITLDSANNVLYVGGRFNGNIDYISSSFTDAPASIVLTNGTDGLVLKITEDGRYLWHKVFGGTGDQIVTNVITDSEGNLIVTGTYESNLIIDGIEVISSAIGGVDCFVAKFNSAGILQFIKSFGGNGTDALTGVAIDFEDEIYIAGFFSAAITIGTHNLSGTGTNSYFAKLTASDGTVSWARAILSSGTGSTHCIIVDGESTLTNRGVYLTGYVPVASGNIDFAGLQVTPDNSKISPYVAKFNAENGDGVWAKIFNTGNTSYGYQVAVNKNKEIFAAGFARDGINIDGQLVATQGIDGYIFKMDSDNGTVTDRKFVVTAGTDYVCGLVVNNTTVYANGMASGTGSANTTVTNFAGTGADFYYRGGSWDVYIMKWGSTSLPVSLIEFKGSRTSMGNLLSWETLSETNNEYFEVERSADGINFSPIKRLAGSGTSTIKINYNYLDTNPLNGINYYRLKQVDINGTFSYSKETVAIDNLLQMEGLKLYPNPGSGIANVQLPSFSADTEINVYSQTGKLVESYTNVSGNNQAIDISKQPIGVYYIQVIEKGKSNLIKYLKQ